MDRGKICRYKITIDPVKGDKWDYFTFKIDNLKDVSVIVTSARRINDCDFKEWVMEEGAIQNITYPMSAYVVARAINWEGSFKFSYKYFNKSEIDYATETPIENMSMAQFMKTPMFRTIILASVLVIAIVLLLMCGVYFMKMRMKNVLYRVQMLEGSTELNKKINAEGLEVEQAEE